MATRRVSQQNMGPDTGRAPVSLILMASGAGLPPAFSHVPSSAIRRCYGYNMTESDNSSGVPLHPKLIRSAHLYARNPGGGPGFEEAIGKLRPVRRVPRSSSHACSAGLTAIYAAMAVTLAAI